MPKIRVEGTSVFVGKTEVRLRFLESFADVPGGGTEARVKVRCHGCGRFKTVARVGLRSMGDGTVDLQPNCVQCRTIMNARKRAGERA